MTYLTAAIVALVLLAALGARVFVRWLAYSWREMKYAYKTFRLVGSQWVERFDPTDACPACWNRGSIHFVNMKRSTLEPAEIETIAQLIVMIDSENEDIGLLRTSVMFKRRNRPAHVCYRPIGAPPDRHVQVTLKSAGSIQ